MDELDDPVREYLREVANAPEFGVAEEAALLETMRAGPDAAERVRKRLIESQLRLVVELARQQAGRRLEMLDMIQDGKVGLLQAVQQYSARTRCGLRSSPSRWLRRRFWRGFGGVR